jgi:hypothetical protein
VRAFYTDREINSYLKATVSGVGTVTNATLRLYSLNVNMGVDVYEARDSWDEGSVTWSNRPGSTGASLAFVNVTTGWTDFDVTSLITGDGIYSFVLKGDADASVRDFTSSEGANVPELLVTHNGTGGTGGTSGGGEEPPRIPVMGVVNRIVLIGLLLALPAWLRIGHLVMRGRHNR